MEENSKWARALGSAVLLFALASAVAYVFSEENLFRPPSSRSRSSTGMKEAERKTESRYEDAENRALGRIQAKELLIILK